MQLQVDVTSKTEGRAFADATGVPLLVKYDTRLRDQVAKGIVDDVTKNVEVWARSLGWSGMSWKPFWSKRLCALQLVLQA